MALGHLPPFNDQIGEYPPWREALPSPVPRPEFPILQRVTALGCYGQSLGARNDLVWPKNDSTQVVAMRRPCVYQPILRVCGQRANIPLRVSVRIWRSLVWSVPAQGILRGFLIMAPCSKLSSWCVMADRTAWTAPPPRRSRRSSARPAPGTGLGQAGIFQRCRQQRRPGVLHDPCTVGRDLEARQPAGSVHSAGAPRSGFT